MKSNKNIFQYKTLGYSEQKVEQNVRCDCY